MNVCACEELSAEVWKMYDGKNTTESCVKLTEDDTTLDLSNCPTSEWKCFDGVQDISNVSCLFSIHYQYPYFTMNSAKGPQPTCPTLTSTWPMNKGPCLTA